jgi:hypothetical protein
MKVQTLHLKVRSLHMEWRTLLNGILLCGLKEGGGETGAGCGEVLGAVHLWQGDAGRQRKAGGGDAPPTSVLKEEEETG